ncbi:MAG: hypothetical protein Q4B96_04075 [Bacillota bacterium]|nr:hypothetical protein [Bacillota bacterium]
MSIQSILLMKYPTLLRDIESGAAWNIEFTDGHKEIWSQGDCGRYMAAGGPEFREFDNQAQLLQAFREQFVNIERLVVTDKNRELRVLSDIR